jgi:hypothetical protein
MMDVARVETERLIIRRRQAGDRHALIICARATGDVLGLAALDPADEPGVLDLGVRLEGDGDHAAEAIAALTCVGLEGLDAERIDMILLADDLEGGFVLRALGFQPAERARPVADGPILVRWQARETQAARRAVEYLRVSGAPVMPRTVTIFADAVSNYAD